MPRDSEEKLYTTSIRRNALEGAGRGVLGGAAASALAHHAGLRIHPAIAPAAGAALGLASGALRGRESNLKDRVREERHQNRREERLHDANRRQAMRKHSYDTAMLASFRDELEKSAFVGSALAGLGKATLRGVGRVAGAQRYGQMLRKGREVAGGMNNLHQAVGAGVAGAGLLGAGYMAGS